MKRPLQVLALLAAALLAVRMMAQDNGGGGTGGGDASGGSTSSGGSGDTGGGTTNGGSTGGTSLPSGTGNQGGGGTGATPATGDLFGPGTGTGGTGGASTIAPEPTPAATPGAAPPGTGAAASPTPAQSPAPNGAARGAAQAAPVTFKVPGGYGGVAPQIFTLGQGRLAKPPISFSVTVSLGYNDNIFSADAHPVATPTPVPAPTPPLEERLVGFRITPPTPPRPIFQTFRPKAPTTPSVAAPTPEGVLGSAISSAGLSVQVQKGTPRSVVTMDASLGAQYYWEQPGEKENYTAGFDMALVERLTPRATLSMAANAVYQETPNYALINAPTNNANNGDYLNGGVKIDLTYTWSNRLSTVTSYSVAANILQALAANNLYQSTYGTQFRYTVSARNTATVEVRESDAFYPSNAVADTSSTFYLLGLDTTFSTKLFNTVSIGLESHSYTSGAGGGQSLPYLESATTLALPRGASLTWTNRYGSEESGSPTETTSSYRTGLSFGQPLSTKLVASVSVAFNDLDTTDTTGAAASYTEKQLQISLGLGYTISPRLSLNLSYSYNDLITTQLNSSYQLDQIFLGGAYSFQ